MNRIVLFIASAAILFLSADAYASTVADAAETESQASRKETAPDALKDKMKNHFKFYGFIRNYFAFDTRESVAGTGDLFYYLPKDRDLNSVGEDLNNQTSFRFLALTTRLGVDISGYRLGRTKFGAKVETDFYSGLSGSTGTATLRLRQAYATIGWDNLSLGSGSDSKASVMLKIGQAWHPLAADQPHVTSLETGAPFNAFSRTPLVLMDASLGKHFIISAGAIWQMQYTSTGPSGATADYIKYSGVPEVYLGFSVKSGGFLGRVGASVLSIKPRSLGTDINGVEVKVKDRLTTVNPYVYLQYTGRCFEVKAKTIYSQGGEHINLMGGYGVTGEFDDGHWEYAPLQTSSTWASISYGRKWQVMLMGGYIRNLGATKDLVNTEGKTAEEDFFFSKNGFKNLNAMWRIIPTVAYNAGKFTLALEYNLTSAQYGTPENGTDSVIGYATRLYNSRGLALNDLHWVCNHRIQLMVKFTF